MTAAVGGKQGYLEGADRSRQIILSNLLAGIKPLLDFGASEQATETGLGLGLDTEFAWECQGT